MEDEKYAVEFHRGYDKDTKKGYYRLVLKSLTDGRVVMDSATHYTNDKQIYFCDVVNINIKELGVNFPADVHEDSASRESVNAWFEAREEKGHDKP